MSKKNILILTSKTGGGHISLAEALRDQLVNGELPEDTKHENVIQDTNNGAISIVDPQPGFIHLHYRLVSRYALWLWAAEFRLGDTTGSALGMHRALTWLLARRLRSLIEQKQPDLIISTYPFLTYEVMQMLERMQVDIPFVMLFADPNGVHASWLTERRATAT